MSADGHPLSDRLRERWDLDREFRTRVVLGGVGSIFLVFLTAAVLNLPAVITMAIPLMIAGVYGVVTYPRETLVLALAGRLVVDLIWWAPSAFGVNSNELYSGGYTALVVVLALLYIRQMQRHFFFVPLLFFFVPMLASALQDTLLLDVGARGSTEFLARSISPVLVMMLASVLLEQENLRRAMIYVVPIAALVPISVSYYHYFNGQMSTYYLDGYFRLQGGYMNLHNHAHAMALFLSFAPLLYFSHRSLWVKAVSIVFAGLSAFPLMMTYVRTTQVGLALFLVVFLVAQRRWFLLFLVGLAAPPLLMQSETFVDRFGEIFAFAMGDMYVDTTSVGSGRLELWREGLNAYLSRPSFQILFGAGSEGAIREAVFMDTVDPHNDYLSLAMVAGPIGLFVYLYFQGMLFRYSLIVRRLTKQRFWFTFANYMLAFNVMVTAMNFISNAYMSRFSLAMAFWTLGGVLLAKYATLTGAWGMRIVQEEDEGSPAFVFPAPSTGPRPST